MDIVQQIMLSGWIVRILTMLIGLAVVYMGYRLYQLPAAPNDAGIVTSAYGPGKVSIQGAAGTFLVVLGTIVMLVTLLRPLVIDSRQTTRTTVSQPSRALPAPAVAPMESVRAESAAVPGPSKPARTPNARQIVRPPAETAVPAVAETPMPPSTERPEPPRTEPPVQPPRFGAPGATQPPAYPPATVVTDTSRHLGVSGMQPPSDPVDTIETRVWVSDTSATPPK